jgi:hypothetical protein
MICAGGGITTGQVIGATDNRGEGCRTLRNQPPSANPEPAGSAESISSLMRLRWLGMIELMGHARSPPIPAKDPTHI